jgi:hypothetical protein
MSGRALRWTTDAVGRFGGRRRLDRAQYASAARMPSTAMIGKKTKGGLVNTSIP